MLNINFSKETQHCTYNMAIINNNKECSGVFSIGRATYYLNKWYIIHIIIQMQIKKPQHLLWLFYRLF